MPVNQALLLGSSQASSGNVVLDDVSASRVRFWPDVATASVTYETDGDVIVFQGDAVTDWVTGESASNFEMRMDVSSGSFSSGATGIWLPMTVNRAWSVSASLEGQLKEATGTLRIRRASTGIQLPQTAAIILTAECQQDFGEL